MKKVFIIAVACLAALGMQAQKEIFSQMEQNIRTCFSNGDIYRLTGCRYVGTTENTEQTFRYLKKNFEKMPPYGENSQNHSRTFYDDELRQYVTQEYTLARLFYHPQYIPPINADDYIRQEAERIGTGHSVYLVSYTVEGKPYEQYFFVGKDTQEVIRTWNFLVQYANPEENTVFAERLSKQQQVIDYYRQRGIAYHELTLYSLGQPLTHDEANFENLRCNLQKYLPSRIGNVAWEHIGKANHRRQNVKMLNHNYETFGQLTLAYQRKDTFSLDIQPGSDLPGIIGETNERVMKDYYRHMRYANTTFVAETFIRPDHEVYRISFSLDGSPRQLYVFVDPVTHFVLHHNNFFALPLPGWLSGDYPKQVVGNPVQAAVERPAIPQGNDCVVWAVSDVLRLLGEERSVDSIKQVIGKEYADGVPEDRLTDVIRLFVEGETIEPDSVHREDVKGLMPCLVVARLDDTLHAGTLNYVIGDHVYFADSQNGRQNIRCRRSDVLTMFAVTLKKS